VTEPDRRRTLVPLTVLWFPSGMIGVMPLTVMAAEVADRLRGAELTCREAGRTGSILPPGYHHLRRSALIGSGPQTFAGAADALLGWRRWWRVAIE